MTKAEKAWEEVKNKGSAHYRGDMVEPIDLMKDGDILWDCGIGSIIGYAYRNRRSYLEESFDLDVSKKACKDLDKIIHWCEILKASML